MVDKKMLDILVCPACKTKIEFINEQIVCDKCERKYPVRDGIPIMLIDEAVTPGQKTEKDNCKQ